VCAGDGGASWKKRHAEGYFNPLSPFLLSDLFFPMGINKSIVCASDRVDVDIAEFKNCCHVVHVH